MVVLQVFTGYTILVFCLSAFFLHPVLKEKRFSTAFLVCFVAGNFYVMNVVFLLLLFFHCANRWVTVAALLLGALLLRIWFGRKQVFWNVRRFWWKFGRLREGTYGWRFFFSQAAKRIFGNLRQGVVFVLARHQMEIFGVLLCLGMQAYYTGARLVMYSGYGGYDEVVHTGWIQHMMEGEIYSAGVYPFGFHEVVYAVAKVFGLQAPQAVRNFGMVIMIYMTLMLYCLVADILDNRIAAFLAVFLYAGVNIYTQTAWDRCGFGFPQEFGAVFLYPMMIFLFLYLKEKKRFYLVFFGMSFSLTLYVHYYITIIALVFCFSIGLVSLVYMCRQKLLVPVLICGIAASLIGASTMVLGVAAGHKLQGSLYWALGVIAGEKGEEGQDLETEELLAVSQGGIVSSAGAVSSSAAVSGSAVQDGGGEKLLPEQEKIQRSFWQSGMQALKKVKNGVVFLADKIYDARLHNCMTENSFWMFLTASVVSLVLAVYYLTFGKEQQKGMFILSFLGYIFLLDILMASGPLGLPTLIENYRVRVFLCYALPFVLAVPMHTIINILGNFYGSEEENASFEQTVFMRLAMIPVTIFALVMLVRYELNRYPLRTTVIQSDSVVDVFYEIADEYEPYTWTLVSDVQEYVMCFGNAYHYEWIDLLQKLSTGLTEIKIPTKYIFFAIEKKPISYGTIITTGSEVPVMGTISKEFAKQGFFYGGDYAYKNQRMQVMAKAYYWALEYAEKFPDEMTVFYEDEDVVYYRLEQEPYYLNNLKIDYGFNSIDVDAEEDE